MRPFFAASPARRPWTALAVYAAVVFAAFASVERFDWIDEALFQLRRRDASDPVLRAAIFLGTYALCIAALVVLYAHASRWVRWPAWALTFVAVAAFLALLRVNGEGFTIHEARLFWAELDYLPQALAFFAGRVAVPVAAAGLGVLLLAWATRRAVPRIRAWWPCALLVLACFVSQRVVFYSFGKIHELPTPFRVAMLLAYAHEDRVPYYGPREEPHFEPRHTPLADHLLLVMDESVSGDLLGINGAPYATTPYLRSLGERVLDYGVISSISNLSSTTGIVLQSGLTPDDIPDRELRSLRDPSLFAYMKRAGYATYYIDAQTYAEPSNFITRFDVEQLDAHIQMIPLEVGTQLWERDHRIVDHVEQILRENERSFVYVLKAGAHIHYEGRYPDSERHFRPTLRADELGALNFEGADRERTFHSYLNALRWTVDDFCRTLFGRIDATGRSALVFYTSDHGQSLLEVDAATGRPERLSHNTRLDPPVYQAMVPLFLVPFGERTRERTRALYDPGLVDRLSQFELFTTLLVSAGYDYGELRARHGPMIFDAQAERGERAFVSGDHFGRASFQWNAYRPRPRPGPGASLR